MEEGQKDNLQLHVQNTFFHVKDAQVEAQKCALRRSASDSSLGFESMASSEGKSSLSAKPVLQAKCATKPPPTTDNSGVQSSEVLRPRRFFPADKDRSGPFPKDLSGSSCPSHLVWSTSESSWSNLDGSSSSNSAAMPPNALPRPVTIGGVETPLMEAPNRMLANGSALSHQLVPDAGYPATTNPGQLPQQGSGEDQGEIQGDGELASLQDEKHANGTCSPCVFWFKAQCTKANKCSYCHLSHTGQKNKRVRPSKKTREARRAAQDKGEEPASGAEEETPGMVVNL